MILCKRGSLRHSVSLIYKGPAKGPKLDSRLWQYEEEAETSVSASMKLQCRAVLSIMIVTSHMWLFKLKLEELKWKIQFLSGTSHILSAQ